MPLVHRAQPFHDAVVQKVLSPGPASTAGLCAAHVAEALLGPARCPDDSAMPPLHLGPSVAWDLVVAEANAKPQCPTAPRRGGLRASDSDDDCVDILDPAGGGQAALPSAPLQPEGPPMVRLLRFLREMRGMVFRLLTAVRRAPRLCQNPDIRFIALYLLQMVFEAKGAKLGGPRAQATLLATVLSLAWKYCDQTARVDYITLHTGLGPSAAVRTADVADAELDVLAACRFHVRVPLWWEAVVQVALAAPHDGSDAKILSITGKRRIVYAATFFDRLLIEIGRTSGADLCTALATMGADELALGGSVAVAAGLATPPEAVTALFRSLFCHSRNMVVQSAQTEALDAYAACLQCLGGILAQRVADAVQHEQQADVAHRVAPAASFAPPCPRIA